MKKLVEVFKKQNKTENSGTKKAIREIQKNDREVSDLSRSEAVVALNSMRIR